MTIFGFPYLKKIRGFSGATAGNWPLFDCRHVRIFIVLANGASEKCGQVEFYGVLAFRL